MKQKNLHLAKQQLVVSISNQSLTMFDNGQLVQSFKISTSKRGAGQIAGSRQTPIGLHVICEKIGAGVPQFGIFKARVFQGVIWPAQTPRAQHKRDHIVTRILRLRGQEPGINLGVDLQGRSVDSFNRAIYIHGTTMEWKLGSPSTIGCIHLSNQDILSLFDTVEVGTQVIILD